jgi:hypothetical protein
MGSRGLQSIPQVSPDMATEIERLVQSPGMQSEGKL